MNARTKIEKQIKLKQEKIAELQSKIDEVQANINAISYETKGLEEALSYLPKEPTERNFEDDVSNMKPDSEVANAYRVIAQKGNAMHVNDILKAMGQDKNQKQALAGQLSYNVREGRIFTRPKPNTFGLIQWPNVSAETPKNDMHELDEDIDPFDLPDDFGNDDL